MFQCFLRFAHLLIFVPGLFCLSTLNEKVSASSQAELSKEEYQQNRVVVRVWHYDVDIKKLDVRRVGHVSLQFPSQYENENYVSFWPAVQRNIGQRKKNLRKGEFYDLIKDYCVENSPPDTIVSLYTLNADKMYEQFRNFKKRVEEDKDGAKTGWALCGDCRFVNKGSKQHSCASLALALLNSGDLRKLFLFSLFPMKCKVSYALQPLKDKVVKTNPLIVTPNNVSDIVIKARKLERTHIKEIKEIPLYENILDFSNSSYSPYKNKEYKEYKEVESPYTHESISSCAIM